MEDEKPTANPFEALDPAEKAAAIKAEMYATHQLHGSMGVYYLFYPEDLQPNPLRPAREERIPPAWTALF